MEKPYRIMVGDNRASIRELAENSVDAIVTDPPYELGFMGKGWDRSGIANDVKFWDDCLRVLKPGGHLLAFSGSRTYHRMTCAIEDAGFEVRDQIMWVYGSGFPKSLNVGKALDKAAGVEREVLARNPNSRENCTKDNTLYESGTVGKTDFITAPATDAAKRWDGWGTALKPAHEPICVARKPLEGTVADNVMKWGTGALNIDASRVGFVSEEDKKESTSKNQHESFGTPPMTGNVAYGDFSMVQPKNYNPPGRWPANLIHDGSEEVLELFPETKTGAIKPYVAKGKQGYNGGWGAFRDFEQQASSGSAARFFYCPKASKKDRDEGCEGFDPKPFKTNQPYGDGAEARAEGNAKGSRNHHPTVKPTDLMAYLCRLVTPPGGLILDPFMGSGSTGKAAMREGFRFVGMELSPDYAAIAEARIAAELANRR